MMDNRWEKVPFSDLVRNFFARKPKDVDGIANTSAMYYREWMLKKIYGRFEWGGIPDSWDMDYLLGALFIDGMFCVTDTAMGVLPLQCGVTGINVFNRPTTVYIANPCRHSKNFSPVIKGKIFSMHTSTLFSSLNNKSGFTYSCYNSIPNRKLKSSRNK